MINMDNVLPFEKRLTTKKIILKDKSDPKGTLGKNPSDRTTSELLKKGIIILHKNQ